jgi:preprotein translocase subunit SecE
MAKDTKALSEKKAKKGNRLLAIPKRMLTAIQNTIAELKKVTWPTRKDLISYTLVVLAFMAVMAIIVGVLDFGASRLISAIIKR